MGQLNDCVMMKEAQSVWASLMMKMIKETEETLGVEAQ
jgi:hypothetical protein